MATTVYVDETKGSDAPGKGSADKPYQTAAYALFVGDAANPPVIFVRGKDGEEYVEITQSALKKAKKNAEGLQKKAQKAEELRLRQEQEKGVEAERLQKKLEDSKKIVLQEDPALPKAIKVCEHLSIVELCPYRSFIRPRSETLSLCVQNASVCLGGCIGCAIRRASSSLYFGVVLVTCRAFSLDNS